MLWCSFPIGWDWRSHDNHDIFTCEGSLQKSWYFIVVYIIKSFRFCFQINWLDTGKVQALWTLDSLVLDRDSCFPGITITISNKITNLVTHSLYSLIVTFVLSTFLRRFSYLWLLFASTSNRGRDLLFLLFFLLSGKICCWSWFSSQMTFSWRLLQCTIRTILKPTKDRNSICNQLVTSAILEIIERFKITFMANV